MNFKHNVAFEQVVKNLDLPAFISGLEGEILIANDRAATLIGHSSGQPLIGRALSDLLIETDSEDIAVLTMSDPLANELLPKPIVLLCGVGRWSAAALRDKNNAPIGILFQKVQPAQNLSNLTDRDLSDATDWGALTESELRWKTAVQSAEQGVWDHDFEFDRHFLSDTWRKMRGIPIGIQVEETTENWLKTIHPDDVDRVERQIALQHSGQTDTINYIFRQRHVHGHWIWILSRGMVVRRDAGGFPARIIGTDTDISDVKAVEQERTQLAERLRVAIAAAEMGQWELRTGTDYAVWDDRALQIFGLSDGKNVRPETEWASLIHPDDREVTVAYNDKCLRELKDMACDYRIITPDGVEKYIRSRGKWVADTGEGASYIGVNLDLTPDYQKTVALETALSRLEYESRHDALTGLGNRRRLDEAFLGLATDPAALPMAAMHLDIDMFKQINNNFGHGAGDFTLRHVATVIQRYLPDDVLVARVGGDEFVALFSRLLASDDLIGIAQQIVHAFGQPFFYNENWIKSGVSIGIAWSDTCDHADDLFIAADIALFHAKKNGRAEVCLYTPEMKDQANQRIRIQDELISAFERDEITCYYQPQFDAETMKLSGVEALVRWNSPTHGLVAPDHFIGAAEGMGFISKLDEIVLRRVLADLDQWRLNGLSVPRVSVNISAQRLMDPNFGEHLFMMNIPRGMIVFELLESVFLDGENKTITENLRQFKQMGIDVEIDDFGTGHASILSLLSIAPKRLKIARELVQPIVSSTQRRALLETIIRIGKMLDIEVVAEGVESQAHIDILRTMKCDYLQGFALGKPMAADEMVQMLRTQQVLKSPSI